MAIQLGHKDLKVFRYHGARCTRGLKRGTWTYQPQNTEQKVQDTCKCPIWAYGYLPDETKIINGKLRPKRINPISLGGTQPITDWPEAIQRVAQLYDLGKIPRQNLQADKSLDNSIITVRHAASEFINSNRKYKDDGDIQASTYYGYQLLVNERLLPWCADNGITKAKEFEKPSVCRAFQESWRRLKPGKNSEKPLAKTSRKLLKDEFGIFLRFCLREGFIEKEGTRIYQKKRGQSKRADEEGIRYGLELSEFVRMMAAPDSESLTPQENAETKAAVALMRYVGMRISDCQKFNSSEIVPNETGTGYNADFLQKKAKTRCVSPVPGGTGVLEMLNSLPGRMVGNKKYYFTCGILALGRRIERLAKRAENDGFGPFSHHFTAHCLRHTFAIQLLNQGVDVRLISKWLGHSNDVITRQHYQHWIKSTAIMAEQKSQEATDRMVAESAKATAELKLAAMRRLQELQELVEPILGRSLEAEN